jgi:hypothetical protein
MNYVDSSNPQVRSALERIVALEELSRNTGVKTYRTVNEILASLSPEVLTAVAVELKKQKGTERHVSISR